MHSTRQTIIFVLIMTSIVALVLSLMSTGLKPIHDKNEAVYNKKAVLAAVKDQLSGDFDALTDDQVDGIFGKQIEQKVMNMKGDFLTEEDVRAVGYKGGKAEHLDMAKEKKKDEMDRILPIYVFTKDDGSKYYIFNVRGMGLWDEIWGNIAFESDLNTIAGVAFDHKGETPGLGAEIKDNKDWANQFVGRKIYDDNGTFRSVGVIKGGAKNPMYEVDGISGATITADGVAEMMKRGLKYYEPFINSVKKG